MTNKSLPAVDAECYLQDLATWDGSVAEWLATQEQLTLTAQHWEVIDLLRDYYQRTEVSPAMRPLVKLVRENLGQDKGQSIYLMQLFGESPAKTAAKLAGLPRPTNCI